MFPCCCKYPNSTEIYALSPINNFRLFRHLFGPSEIFEEMWSRVFVRGLSGKASIQPAGVVPNTSRYKRIQELQTRLCKDDGLLVWQKMGTRDKFLYYSSLFIMFAGFVPLTGLLLKLSFPRKAE